MPKTHHSLSGVTWLGALRERPEACAHVTRARPRISLAPSAHSLMYYVGGVVGHLERNVESDRYMAISQACREQFSHSPVALT
jgi:hypothetical protein